MVVRNQAYSDQTAADCMAVEVLGYTGSALAVALGYNLAAVVAAVVELGAAAAAEALVLAVRILRLVLHQATQLTAINRCFLETGES